MSSMMSTHHIRVDSGEGVRKVNVNKEDVCAQTAGGSVQTMFGKMSLCGSSASGGDDSMTLHTVRGLAR